MYVTDPTQFVETYDDDKIVPEITHRRTMTLKPGKHLFLEGDPANRIYEVTSGVLRLTRMLEDGRRQVIAFGYPGDTVGFPSDGYYHTDCDAIVPTTLVVHRRSDLETSKGDAALHQRLLRAALREISAMQDHFMMLGRKSSVEKLASFLMVLTDRVGTPLGDFTQVSLPMTRSDIADFLGLTTETVSRTFTQLRKSKIVAIDHINTVIILKPKALRSIAEGQDD
ncbi:helix-turn-helix domain-containing protein [Yoonia sediminilitoris]|uniref:CRP/FNR family transcriptional regulator/CRP/FNR family nitrogen fixation transcriptional regulator n=1 Tax=Yoonia sediminilitoris TaxID=1286148 RepID=A0A2T6KIT1_9RHOB|nr:helix-turn-helix domain-containing protein [Yoonia sediminilitoris]PUB15627.1 CRP/FNR family transcriptional regulator/CRP/FNR family nitrogen fixation transcriptional regulator [Yoonia sediminilitoris]RCW96236.1 CRP/FNR family transcriptional regulator/CRP/FNR family nitrogen fixation transcriptional regulator [Yoonia sediminilitoris]